jgi:hypothetical protein
MAADGCGRKRHRAPRTCGEGGTRTPAQEAPKTCPWTQNRVRHAQSYGIAQCSQDKHGTRTCWWKPRKKPACRRKCAIASRKAQGERKRSRTARAGRAETGSQPRTGRPQDHERQGAEDDRHAIEPRPRGERRCGRKGGSCSGRRHHGSATQARYPECGAYGMPPRARPQVWPVWMPNGDGHSTHEYTIRVGRTPP